MHKCVTEGGGGKNCPNLHLYHYFCVLIAILLFIKLVEHCNNDCEMFAFNVSFDMRINNKTLFELN